jgi:hypothetical protein
MKYIWYYRASGLFQDELAVLIDGSFKKIRYQGITYHASLILKTFHKLDGYQDDSNFIWITSDSAAWQDGTKFDTFDELKKCVWLTQGIVINE